jgi:hypothetical protein
MPSSLDRAADSAPSQSCQRGEVVRGGVSASRSPTSPGPPDAKDSRSAARARRARTRTRPSPQIASTGRSRTDPAPTAAAARIPGCPSRWGTAGVGGAGPGRSRRTSSRGPPCRRPPSRRSRRRQHGHVRAVVLVEVGLAHVHRHQNRRTRHRPVAGHRAVERRPDGEQEVRVADVRRHLGLVRRDPDQPRVLGRQHAAAGERRDDRGAQQLDEGATGLRLAAASPKAPTALAAPGPVVVSAAPSPPVDRARPSAA